MINDFKYALRMLIKAPAFTIIAVLTLALGIGANSAIFSVVQTVLLRPLPFPKPELLAMIWNSSTKEPGSRQTQSIPDFYDLRSQSQSFTGMFAYTDAGMVLGGAGEAQELSGIAVNGDFFDVLGVAPLLGRGFTADEAKNGQPNVAVISHGLWKRAFASDPAAVGQQVTMSTRSYRIIGVMPTGWKFPIDAETIDVVVPIEQLATESITQRGAHFLRIVGRRKPAVSFDQAEQELKAIAARLAERYPDTNTDRSISLVPLLEEVIGNVRPALLVLLGAVALVLLNACANVANLLVARAAARQHEFGIRTALGASRASIVRQLLVESLLLALLGAGAGLLLAWWSIDVLGTFGPRNVPRLADVGINAGVTAYTFGIAIASTLLFGLVPALQVSRGNLTDVLQQGAKGSTGGLQGSRAREILIVLQVSLSLLLLASAGLLIRTFFNLQATNVGFEPQRLLVLEQILPRSTYAEPDKQRSFYQRLLPELAAIPGVGTVGAATPLPFSGDDSGRSFRMERDPERGPGTHPDASNVIVTPGYFRTMSIPLRAGRDFSERDNETAPGVALVNDTFARRFLPNVNPIGERILIDYPGGGPRVLQIIGVVGDAKQNEIGSPVLPEMYRAFAQTPGKELGIVFRTASANLTGLQAAVQRVVHAQDDELFVRNLEPMQQMIGDTLAQPRFNMLLLAVFAAVAMTLAAIGIYGVIAYSVAQRTREIGIRMALGGQRGDMLTMILRQSLTVVAVGLGIGLVAAFAATRLLASLLYGVGANDLFTYAAVVLLLGVAALLASYIPARRAMKVDPMVALRYE